MSDMELELLKRRSEYAWEIPKQRAMRVPAVIYADEALMREMDAKVYEQAVNVATLPGIVEASYAMPDAHWGYGFPIGGVAAVDATDGAISPGGIGYDINCGVRLLRSSLREADVRAHLPALMDRLYESIPAGVHVTFLLDSCHSGTGTRVLEAPEEAGEVDLALGIHRQTVGVGLVVGRAAGVVDPRAGFPVALRPEAEAEAGLRVDVVRRGEKDLSLRFVADQAIHRTPDEDVGVDQDHGVSSFSSNPSMSSRSTPGRAPRALAGTLTGPRRTPWYVGAPRLCRRCSFRTSSKGHPFR